MKWFAKALDKIIGKKLTLSIEDEMSLTVALTEFEKICENIDKPEVTIELNNADKLNALLVFKQWIDPEPQSPPIDTTYLPKTLPELERWLLTNTDKEVTDNNNPSTWSWRQSSEASKRSTDLLLILVTALILGTKLNRDPKIKLNHFTAATQIPVKLLNAAEAHYLNQLNYNLNFKDDDLATLLSDYFSRKELEELSNELIKDRSWFNIDKDFRNKFNALLTAAQLTRIPESEEIISAFQKVIETASTTIKSGDSTSDEILVARKAPINHLKTNKHIRLLDPEQYFPILLKYLQSLPSHVSALFSADILLGKILPMKIVSELHRGNIADLFFMIPMVQWEETFKNLKLDPYGRMCVAFELLAMAPEKDRTKYIKQLKLVSAVQESRDGAALANLFILTPEEKWERIVPLFAKLTPFGVSDFFNTMLEKYPHLLETTFKKAKYPDEILGLLRYLLELNPKHHATFIKASKFYELPLVENELLTFMRDKKNIRHRRTAEHHKVNLLLSLDKAWLRNAIAFYNGKNPNDLANLLLEIPPINMLSFAQAIGPDILSALTRQHIMIILAALEKLPDEKDAHTQAFLNLFSLNQMITMLVNFPDNKFDHYLNMTTLGNLEETLAKLDEDTRDRLTHNKYDSLIKRMPISGADFYLLISQKELEHRITNFQQLSDILVSLSPTEKLTLVDKFPMKALLTLAKEDIQGLKKVLKTDDQNLPAYIHLLKKVIKHSSGASIRYDFKTFAPNDANYNLHMKLDNNVLIEISDVKNQCDDSLKEIINLYNSHAKNAASASHLINVKKF